MPSPPAGYSLYPWICALFLSSLCDTFPNHYVSPQMPLYVLGLPAAIAQVLHSLLLIYMPLHSLYPL